MITKLIKIKEKAFEKFDELQEKGRQHWIALKPREKLILSIVAGITSVMLFLFLINEVHSYIESHTGRVDETMKNIGTIRRLADQLSSQRGDMVVYDRMRSTRTDDFKLTTFIEGEAKKLGVSVSKIAPTQAKGGAKDEDWVELQWGQETRLDSLLRFLESVQNALGVRIVSMTIKPQFSDPSKLEGSAVIASMKSL